MQKIELFLIERYEEKEEDLTVRWAPKKLHPIHRFSRFFSKILHQARPIFIELYSVAVFQLVPCNAAPGPAGVLSGRPAVGHRQSAGEAAGARPGWRRGLHGGGHHRHPGRRGRQV